MGLVHYREQKDQPGVMLPSGRHVVDKHGTIRNPVNRISKKERARWKRQQKGK